jgi:hypothetical protein
MIMKKTQTPNNDWQRIWLAAGEKQWGSLVLIPNDASVDVVRCAEALAATGQVHAERPVKVVNATGIQLGSVQETVDNIVEMTRRGERVIVAVDPLADNPAVIAIVRGSPAALLIVRLEESLMASARSTVDMVGRDRLIGSIVLQPDALAQSTEQPTLR